MAESTNLTTTEHQQQQKKILKIGWLRKMKSVDDLVASSSNIIGAGGVSNIPTLTAGGSSSMMSFAAASSQKIRYFRLAMSLSAEASEWQLSPSTTTVDKDNDRNEGSLVPYDPIAYHTCLSTAASTPTSTSSPPKKINPPPLPPAQNNWCCSELYYSVDRQAAERQDFLGVLCLSGKDVSLTSPFYGLFLHSIFGFSGGGQQGGGVGTTSSSFSPAPSSSMPFYYYPNVNSLYNPKLNTLLSTSGNVYALELRGASLNSKTALQHETKGESKSYIFQFIDGDEMYAWAVALRCHVAFLSRFQKYVQEVRYWQLAESERIASSLRRRSQNQKVNRVDAGDGMMVSSEEEGNDDDDDDDDDKKDNVPEEEEEVELRKRADTTFMILETIERKDEETEDRKGLGRKENLKDHWVPHTVFLLQFSSSSSSFIDQEQEGFESRTQKKQEENVSMLKATPASSSSSSLQPQQQARNSIVSSFGTASVQGNNDPMYYLHCTCWRASYLCGLRGILQPSITSNMLAASRFELLPEGVLWDTRWCHVLAMMDCLSSSTELQQLQQLGTHNKPLSCTPHRYKLIIVPAELFQRWKINAEKIQQVSSTKTKTSTTTKKKELLLHPNLVPLHVEYDVSIIARSTAEAEKMEGDEGENKKEPKEGEEEEEGKEKVENPSSAWQSYCYYLRSNILIRKKGKGSTSGKKNTKDDKKAEEEEEEQRDITYSLVIDAKYQIFTLIRDDHLRLIINAAAVGGEKRFFVVEVNLTDAMENQQWNKEPESNVTRNQKQKLPTQSSAVEFHYSQSPKQRPIHKLLRDQPPRIFDSTMKIVIVGCGRVGKSTLSAWLWQAATLEQQLGTTRAASMMSQSMYFSVGATERQLRWSIAGGQMEWSTAVVELPSSSSPALITNHCMKAQLIIVVFDYTDMYSFRWAEDFCREKLNIGGSREKGGSSQKGASFATKNAVSSSGSQFVVALAGMKCNALRRAVDSYRLEQFCEECQVKQWNIPEVTKPHQAQSIHNTSGDGEEEAEKKAEEEIRRYDKYRKKLRKTQKAIAHVYLLPLIEQHCVSVLFLHRGWPKASVEGILRVWRQSYESFYQNNNPPGSPLGGGFSGGIMGSNDSCITLLRRQRKLEHHKSQRILQSRVVLEQLGLLHVIQSDAASAEIELLQTQKDEEEEKTRTAMRKGKTHSRRHKREGIDKKEEEEKEAKNRPARGLSTHRVTMDIDDDIDNGMATTETSALDEESKKCKGEEDETTSSSEYSSDSDNEEEEEQQPEGSASQQPSPLRTRLFRSQTGLNASSSSSLSAAKMPSFQPHSKGCSPLMSVALWILLWHDLLDIRAEIIFWNALRENSAHLSKKEQQILEQKTMTNRYSSMPSSHTGSASQSIASALFQVLANASPESQRTQHISNKHVVTLFAAYALWIQTESANQLLFAMSGTEELVVSLIDFERWYQFPDAMTVQYGGIWLAALSCVLKHRIEADGIFGSVERLSKYLESTPEFSKGVESSGGSGNSLIVPSNEELVLLSVLENVPLLSSPTGVTGVAPAFVATGGAESTAGPSSPACVTYCSRCNADFTSFSRQKQQCEKCKSFFCAQCVVNVQLLNAAATGLEERLLCINCATEIAPDRMTHSKPVVISKWERDEKVSNCRICNAKFTLFTRKHHCRACGSVVCHACSPSFQVIAGYSTPQRICAVCEVAARKRQEQEEQQKVPGSPTAVTSDKTTSSFSTGRATTTSPSESSAHQKQQNEKATIHDVMDTELPSSAGKDQKMSFLKEERDDGLVDAALLNFLTSNGAFPWTPEAQAMMQSCLQKRKEGILVGNSSVVAQPQKDIDPSNNKRDEMRRISWKESVENRNAATLQKEMEYDLPWQETYSLKKEIQGVINADLPAQTHLGYRLNHHKKTANWSGEVESAGGFFHLSSRKNPIEEDCRKDGQGGKKEIKEGKASSDCHYYEQLNGQQVRAEYVVLQPGYLDQDESLEAEVDLSEMNLLGPDVCVDL